MSEAAHSHSLYVHYAVRMTTAELEVELMSGYKQSLYRSITRKVNNFYCHLEVAIFLPFYFVAFNKF
jgi:hypothetical protein